eukprot:TRINITY_DN51835_c0_g1_i1.p1 TRINITY_DN51835_c0_g1~~TRINITY_DN51835_c0_g1_i1.p1  ORF type:complete len:106 (-),score=33.74 TRINITY_DN51835_c0_g1_i1:75-392(-)
MLRSLVGSEMCIRDSRDISWSAVLIVLAMLWSSLFESAFTVLYWTVKGHTTLPEEECPDRIGTYACPYAGEEESSEWAIVLPAFFVACGVVVAVLFAMSLSLIHL